MSQETEGTIARDASEALELWDKGETIAAFEVETERCTQLELYTAAFELIRVGRMFGNRPEFGHPSVPDSIASKISKRERDVAYSIAYVAMLKGWAGMVAQHLAGGNIKAITIKKPA